MGLLSKLGEKGAIAGLTINAGRSLIVNGVRDLAGINNGVSYPEYKYDANGRICGIADTTQTRETFGLDANPNVITQDENIASLMNISDSKFKGLTTSVSKLKSIGAFKKVYPTKYKNYVSQGSQSSEINNGAAKNVELQKAQQELYTELKALEDAYRTRIDKITKKNDAQTNQQTEGEQQAVDPNAAENAQKELEAIHNDYINKRDKLLNKYQAKYGELDPYANVKSTYGLLYNDQTIESTINKNSDDFTIDRDAERFSDVYTLKLPDWTYADFINERAIWQKGLSSVLDEPGWFYFKIFFDFQTNHGLFGGILNSPKFTNTTNSAAKYLYSIRKYHKLSKAKDRINALHKFTSILSFISNNAPWYFKNIKNLNNVTASVINDFSKEKSIEIGVAQDAIDMRLSTLMSLYNFACFDSFYGKEVIPENLRKFNMSIIVFQTPLRYLHTSFTSKKDMQYGSISVTGAINEVKNILGMSKSKEGNAPSIKYKSMSINNHESDNFGDLMSMKIYTFYGCEFDNKSFGSIMPGEISNTTPFQLGNGSIKITYTFCTEHTMNEFYGMMWGNDGFYFNQYNNFQLSDMSFNGYVNKNEKYASMQERRYQALRDILENIVHGGSFLGIVDMPTTYKQVIDASEAIMNGIYDSGGFLKDLGTNALLGVLGSSYSTKAPQGNLYGDVGINSAYFKDKLSRLKYSEHVYTEPPYYKDPETQARIDILGRHSGFGTSMSDFNDLFNSTTSFNIGKWFGDTKGWMDNNINFNDPAAWIMNSTQKAASKINDMAESALWDTSGIGYSKNINTEKPYTPNPYTIASAYGIDANKWEGNGKNHNMVDDPNTWMHTQKPNKAEGIQQDYTYDRDRQQKAINDNLKENGFKLVGEAGKNKLMVDDPNTWTYTEAPYNYESKNSVDYENSKAGGKDKLQILTDEIGNPVNERTEAPFKYESDNAVNYENSKAGGKDKLQVLTDEIGNPVNERTEAPFKYESDNAVNYENNKAGDVGKTQVLTDKIGNDEHEVTEAPFKYESKEAIKYENNKAGDVGKTQILTDNTSGHKYTETPFNYDSKNAIDYENSKAGGESKTQVLVDKIGNPEHEYTEPPYDYNPLSITNGLVNAHDYTEPPYDYDEMNAVNYENSKAGGEGKTQVLTDGIGNDEHEYTEPPYDYDPLANKSEFVSNNEFTEAPYDYDPLANKSEFNSNHEFTEAPYDYDEMNAVNYENSKAGGEGKTQVLTDGIGNDEHEYTEAPYDYDPLSNKSEFNSNHEFTEAPYDYDNSSKAEEVDSEHNFTEAPYKYEPSKNTAISKHNYTEAPYDYDEMNAINYENSKAGGIGKTQVLTDGIGNDEHEYTEAPFAYDGKNAIDYEMNKTNSRYKEFKSKEMVDGVGNPLHEFTEAPYDYDPLANKTETPSDHNFTEEPFKYESMEAVNYENSKAGGERKTQVLVDKIGNPEHEYTEPPYHYDASNDKKQFNSENIFTEEPFAYDSMNAIEYENSKAGEMNKTQVLVDGIGNDEHEYTEEPFAYDSINAIDYENSKAGEEGKTQVLVDKIGNPEHEYTEPPYKYDPATAVEYENSKAGEMNKIQVMVDEIGNPIHQVTESPFKYAGKESENYEHGKAGGEYKTEAILNDFRAPVHYYTEGPYKGSGLHNYDLSKYLRTQNTNRNED